MTPAPAPITTVIFDYAGTLALPPPEEEKRRLEHVAGVEPEAFWDAFWAERPRYNTTGDAPTFWTGVQRATGARWTPEQHHELWALDMRSNLLANVPVLRAARRVARLGLRTVLFSDCPPDLAAILRRSPALAAFEDLYFSCDLGATKSSPGLFRTVLEGLGATAGQCLFIDDGDSNVQTAATLGMRAHRYTDGARLDRFLSEQLAGYPPNG
ncbi:HAD-IA family hydrolase [Actinomadura hibisca]|uniref:HAD-IA family hydrolase n=1 Tax=Actinomadura hibisca TaxID=68565 RepID=UPI000831D288|nr:HAD-IA family hydrolase [Actinomadura hibisca]